jgi:thiamine pyrophosphokinase
VAGAPLQWTPELAALAASAKPLLAADSGADHLARLGLRPELVIGDLDSLRAATRAWLGEGAMLLLPDQDRTDLDKALEHAFGALAVDSLIVLAATGGRVDHDAVNLGLLARLALGERLRFVTATTTTLAVSGTLALVSQPDETWSFWTYDADVRVWLEGVRWPIENESLQVDVHPSISNIATGDRVNVRCKGGSVVVVRHHSGAATFQRSEV